MGLVALVAFVAVAGVPGMTAPASGLPAMPEPDVVDPQASAGDTRAVVQKIEIDLIIESLKSLPNAPEIIQTKGPGPDEPGTNPDSPSLVAFLGAVIATNHRAAMLRAGDDKAWVGEGQSKDLGGRSVRVLEVHSDYVRLEINGAEQRLDRAERTGSAVASVLRTEDRGGGNAMDFGGRRRGLEDARNEMLRAPTQDRLQARRSANALLERAREMEETDPERAEQLRKRAERILSINPSVGTLGSTGGAIVQDPER